MACTVYDLLGLIDASETIGEDHVSASIGLECLPESSSPIASGHRNQYLRSLSIPYIPMHKKEDCMQSFRVGWGGLAMTAALLGLSPVCSMQTADADESSFIAKVLSRNLVEGQPRSFNAAAKTTVFSPKPSKTPRVDRTTGRTRGIKPFRSPSGIHPDVTPICTSTPQLTYFGGPLLQSADIVAVFWNSGVNTTLVQNIGQFYKDVTNSSFWGWLQEYDSVGLSPGSNQAILAGSFGGGFTITPAKCASGTSTCNLTDTDLQNELIRQIGLGVLPAPTLDCTGNVKTLYMIDLPSNISLAGPGGAGTSCVAGGFCAYHNTGVYGPHKIPLVYAAFPDVFTGGCTAGCGMNSTALQNATYVHSSLLVDAVTDPDIGLDTSNNYAFPGGWGDNNCGEISDICDDGSTGDTITVSGRSWTVQQMWSNAQGKCTSTGTPPAICSGTTVTNCRKCSCGDNGMACNGATSSFCETDSGNVLFGACEACTTSSGNCGAGTCTQSSTPALDDICSLGVVEDGGVSDLGALSDGAVAMDASVSDLSPPPDGAAAADASGIDLGALPDGAAAQAQTAGCGACKTPQSSPLSPWGGLFMILLLAYERVQRRRMDASRRKQCQP